MSKPIDYDAPRRPAVEIEDDSLEALTARRTAAQPPSVDPTRRSRPKTSSCPAPTCPDQPARRRGRKFREQLGQPPKTLARLVRFRSTVRRVRGEQRWEPAVFGSGYYDQAHFSRDMRQFTGATRHLS